MSINIARPWNESQIFAKHILHQQFFAVMF